MAKLLILFTLLILYIVIVESEDVDYYWRDYEGEIPEDAISAGRDANDKDVYIGQILCSKHKDNFSWLRTSAKTLQRDIIGKHAVAGGYNGKVEGIYSIGRVMYDKSTQVGPISSFYPGNADFYFVYKNKHFLFIKTYEVLIYSKEH
ncbi:DUF3421 domain containing protein [Asbolus verrucosus]|uniref:DUF3421 domain containing protein n=1 Tax=Asbolus verrucosus TaxID=1661398 RepID=A0A482VMF9_ASBVE|nr:DUF3421 domain containing protein [Asbolus verrucosus]